MLRAVSVTAQLLFVVVLIELFLYAPAISGALAGYARELAETGLGSRLPPLWFFGLYETMLGTEVGGNWLFRMTERDRKTGYLRGARTALALLGLAPLALASAPLYALAWGPVLAAAHTLLWVLTGMLLAEVLVTGLRKVPFACTYVPGKANMKVLVLPYFGLTLLYGHATARWELWLLDHPARWLPAIAVLAFALAAARVTRATFGRPPAALTYDETPDPAVQRLHLMRPV